MSEVERIKQPSRQQRTRNHAMTGVTSRAAALVLLALGQVVKLDAQVLCCQRICTEATNSSQCLAKDPAAACPPQDCVCAWTNTTQVSSSGSIIQVSKCDAFGEVTVDEEGGLGFGFQLLIGAGCAVFCIALCCGGWFMRNRQQREQVQGSGPWQSQGARPGSFRERNSKKSSQREVVQPILSPQQLEEVRMPPAMSAEEATEITGYGTPSMSRQPSHHGSVRDLYGAARRNGSAASHYSGDESPALSRQSSYHGSRRSTKGSRRRMVENEPAAMARETSGEISISVRTPRSDSGSVMGDNRSMDGRSVRSGASSTQGSQRSLRSASARSQTSFRSRGREGGSYRGHPRGPDSFGGSFGGRARSVHSEFSASSSRLSRYTANSGMTRHYDDTPSTAYDGKKLGEDAFSERLFSPAVSDYGLKKPDPQTFTLIPKDSDRVQKVALGPDAGPSPRNAGPSPRNSMKKAGGEEKKKRRRKKDGSKAVSVESRKRASLLFNALEDDLHSSQLFSKYPTAPIKEENKEDGSASLRNSTSNWTLLQGGEGNGEGNGAAGGRAQVRKTGSGIDRGKKPPALDLAGGGVASGRMVEGSLGFVNHSADAKSDENSTEFSVDETTATDLTSAFTSQRPSQEFGPGDEMELGGGVDEEQIMTPSALRARARLHSDHVSVLASGETTPAMSRSVSGVDGIVEQTRVRRLSKELEEKERQRERRKSDIRRPSAELQVLLRDISESKELEATSASEPEDGGGFPEHMMVTQPAKEQLQPRDRAREERGGMSPQQAAKGAHARKKKAGKSPEPMADGRPKPPSPEVHPYHRVSTVAEECTFDLKEMSEHQSTIVEEGGEDLRTPSGRAQAGTNENIITGDEWSIGGVWSK